MQARPTRQESELAVCKWLYGSGKYEVVFGSVQKQDQTPRLAGLKSANYQEWYWKSRGLRPRAPLFLKVAGFIRKRGMLGE